MTHTIVALRAKVRGSLMAELEKSLAGRLRHLPDADRKALDTMVEAAVKKLLHTPMLRIKAMARDPRGDELVATLHDLFDLGDAVREVPGEPRAPRDVPSHDEVGPSVAPPDRENIGR